MEKSQRMKDPFETLVIPLIALSVVAKGLAKEAMELSKQYEKNLKGEKKDVKDE
ncbi:MAG: hypothetical protein ACI32E_04825 [Bacilli bacterium]|jgi:hypothetical protein|nr:hypothetical protein [Clostridiales bacterium]